MGTKDILEELYDLFQKKMPYHMDDMEILRVKKKLEAIMEDADKEKTILDYGIAYERAGFRYGFVLAVCIMSHCMTEIL